MWSPPDRMVTDEHRMRTHALYTQMCEAIGPESAHRLAVYDAVLETGLPPEKSYWYLGILAAHPARAARGSGRAVMNAGLQHVRSENGKAILETANARNPAYYEQSGWRVLNTLPASTLPASTLPGSALPFKIWVLEYA
jgi:GNAT superfamily N-acetyltransferase